MPNRAHPYRQQTRQLRAHSGPCRPARRPRSGPLARSCTPSQAATPQQEFEALTAELEDTTLPRAQWMARFEQWREVLDRL